MLGLTAATMAQVPNYVPTNGLVGWWPFTGNANDSSINKNNGTVNGATLTTDRFGKTNSAYAFDGNDNIVASPIASTAGLSVSFWTNNIDSLKGGDIVTQSVLNNPAQVNWQFGYLPNTQNHEAKSGSFKSLYRTSCSTTGTDELYHNTLDVKKWNHVVFTIANDGTSTIYINGVPVKSQKISAFPNCSPFNGSTLRFGGPWHPGDPIYFNGKIDDIGIWGRPLTQQEITDLYNNKSVGIIEYSQSNLFSVFPNPAQNVINVKADSKLIGSVYSIYDNIGRVVLSGKLNAESTTIELGNLSGGIYILSAGENMKQTFKVIKE